MHVVCCPSVELLDNTDQCGCSELLLCGEDVRGSLKATCAGLDLLDIPGCSYIQFGKLAGQAWNAREQGTAVSMRMAQLTAWKHVKKGCRLKIVDQMQDDLCSSLCRSLAA
jgi:hypothetical protein